jgi:hypothetical protein
MPAFSESGSPAPVQAFDTEELPKTSNDRNRAAVTAMPGQELNLAGLAVYSRRGEIDKILKGLPLHR